MFSNLIRLADRFGTAASFLCAAHCMALPFVLVLLPAIGLSILADHAMEHTFIGITSGLATITSTISYQRHQCRRVFGFLLPGLASLWLGVFLDGEITIGLHAILMSTGGALLAVAHWTNLQLAQNHRHTAYCQH